MDAVVHLIWTPDGENGFACEDHRREALTRWCPYAVHELGPDCGMPDSRFIEEENTCRVPDEWSPELATREEVGVPG